MNLKSFFAVVAVFISCPLVAYVKMHSSKFCTSKSSKDRSKENTMLVSGKVPPQSMLKQNVLQAKSLNTKDKIKKPSSKTSVKDFFSSIPTVSYESKRNLVIYDETSQEAKKVKSVGIQTSLSNDVVDLMCSEEPTEKYWELLAEERRKALTIALDENEKLAAEIKEKTETIADMKAEMEILEESSSHAQYLASVIRELGKECLGTDVTGDADDRESLNDDDSTDDSIEQKESTENSNESPSISSVIESSDEDSSSASREDGSRALDASAQGCQTIKVHSCDECCEDNSNISGEEEEKSLTKTSPINPHHGEVDGNPNFVDGKPVRQETI